MTLVVVSLIPVNKGTQLFIGTHISALPLRDQTHRKLMNRPFQFQKCGQYFIGTDNETLSVAMRVHNPDC
jgi:hypothetical protein